MRRIMQIESRQQQGIFYNSSQSIMLVAIMYQRKWEVMQFNGEVCVEVTAKFDTDGTMTPVSFVWEDGIIYNIDQIKAKERCVSQRSGDTGIVYTVVVAGKECHLFYKFDKWFMERK